MFIIKYNSLIIIMLYTVTECASESQWGVSGYIFSIFIFYTISYKGYFDRVIKKN